MYVAVRSALIPPQPQEDRRRRLRSLRQGQRIGQVRQIPLAVFEVARRPESVEGIRRQGHEYGNGTTAIGDLNALPALHPSQQLTGSLP
jgi:hypothetical protein